MFLEYPPRVRVEWSLAAARLVLAGGALLAVSFDTPAGGWAVPHLLVWYLIFSLGVVAFVWAPVRFGRGADVALHAFDLGVFAALMVITDGAPGPFFLAVVYLLVCATVRWYVAGTLLTATAAAVLFAAATVYRHGAEEALLDVRTATVRLVYLIVVASLLAYLAAHQRRYHNEISHLAGWPRTMSREPYAVVSEILSRASDLLNGPRIVLLWFDAEETVLNVAWLEHGQVKWTQEPPDAYGSPVMGILTGRAFQTPNAASDRARVVILRPGRFVRRRCRPVNEQLRERFNMRSVQSWPLDGELVRGRIFCLDKSALPLDDLSIGEFVAQLATSRLDGLYLLGRLQDARGLEERVRVARDLHDGLLQSQAGAALQLLAARRMLERDPAAAKQRLEEVQQHLERGELEMRAFIRDLRPARAVVPTADRLTLRQRLTDQAERIERQWNVGVTVSIDPAADQLGDKVTTDVFRLVQEGLVNAARHAQASSVRVELSVTDGRVNLTIADDGKGFPFTGVYDLKSLARMDQGPLTLRERVTDLEGNLTLITSRETGTELLITVPLGTA